MIQAVPLQPGTVTQPDAAYQMSEKVARGVGGIDRVGQRTCSLVFGRCRSPGDLVWLLTLSPFAYLLHKAGCAASQFYHVARIQ